ncbi:uncharacterized protein LOC108673334, partial [Hyalella azteca]|uniref:WW domain binding protein VOPP1 n=1 Tax=Hyalella azteca TaxID=294128 RepID=A0A8B7NSE3_HYAAZ
CRYQEYCCSQGCCSPSAVTFYQLWYFWLVLLLVGIVCSGYGWYFKHRYAGGLSNLNPHPPLRRRPPLRHRIYPRYLHDTAPPSYGEVMRRQQDYPQARPAFRGGAGQRDPGWINSPPPPYETIHDLRRQESKLEQEIKQEDQRHQQGPHQVDEVLRRGASARERPKLSARQRIKLLLGKGNYRGQKMARNEPSHNGSNQNGYFPGPNEDQNFEDHGSHNINFIDHDESTNGSGPLGQAAFTITGNPPIHPLAWSYNSPNTYLIQPYMQAIPSLDLLPPYRPPPEYQYCAPYRYGAEPNIEEWSAHENIPLYRPLTAMGTRNTSDPASSTAGANASSASASGTLMDVEDNELASQASVSSAEIKKVFEDIRSPLTPITEPDLVPQILDVDQRNIEDDEVDSISKTILTTNEKGHESHYDSDAVHETRVSTAPRLSLTPEAPILSGHSSNLSTPNRKLSSRPVSSTALPTPGIASPTVILPGAYDTSSSEPSTSELSTSEPFHVSSRSPSSTFYFKQLPSLASTANVTGSQNFAEVNSPAVDEPSSAMTGCPHPTITEDSQNNG